MDSHDQVTVVLVVRAGHGASVRDSAAEGPEGARRWAASKKCSMLEQNNTFCIWQSFDDKVDLMRQEAMSLSDMVVSCLWQA